VKTRQQIAELKPTVLILSGNFNEPLGDGTSVKAEAAKAVRRAPAGTRVVVFSNTPHAPMDVPRCLADHLTSTKACEPRTAEEWTLLVNAKLADAASETGAAFVDLTPLLCTVDRCPAIAENTLVYRDASHLTTAFTESRAKDLGVLLQKAIGPTGGR
jgi:hypothetical protein